jgi:hypothetical protein
MRKVEKQMIDAILQKQCKTISNTTVVTTRDNDLGQISEVYLHGNKIASIYWQSMALEVSNCGWQTVTTKSRLNAILGKFCNIGIAQRKGQWLYANYDSVEGWGKWQTWQNKLLFGMSFKNCNYLAKVGE